MAKMDKKWVVLCSTAVAAVYSAAYLSTEGQVVAASQPVQHPVANVQSNTNQTNQTNQFGLGHHHRDHDFKRSDDNYHAPPSDSNTSSSTASTTSTPSTNTGKASYKSGTYTGTGMNRRGMMNVAVSIKNNKIIDVEISNWGMHYSESDVVGLPNEVLQNQSAQVANVSGATYSTEAFAQAVQDALNQAQNG